ncbi:MAG: sporulation membrane protein YtaF [Anaerotignaceae bacterium]
MVYKIIILALALSIDAFGAGLSLGVRNISISHPAKIIVFFQSVAITFLALLLGDTLKNILPSFLADYLGTFLLVTLGIWIIYNSKKKAKPKVSPKIVNKEIKIFIKHFGITIQIAKTPQSCDLDNSATIDTFEAIYLGFALSIDAFGAVTGAGLMGGFTNILPFLTAIIQIALLTLGTKTGKSLKSICSINNSMWSSLSGGLLIIMGIIYIIF